MASPDPLLQYFAQLVVPTISVWMQSKVCFPWAHLYRVQSSTVGLESRSTILQRVAHRRGRQGNPPSARRPGEGEAPQREAAPRRPSVDVPLAAVARGSMRAGVHPRI